MSCIDNGAFHIYLKMSQIYAVFYDEPQKIFSHFQIILNTRFGFDNQTENLLAYQIRWQEAVFVG